MSKNFHAPWTIGTSVFAVLALAAPASAEGREQGSQGKHRVPPRPRAVSVRVVNDAAQAVPVLNVGKVEIIGPMFSPAEMLVRSVDLSADGPNGTSVSLPAVQEWLVMEVDVLPLPPAGQKTSQACVASLQVPIADVNGASNLPAIMSVSWGGTDFRSFHRPLPLALKREVGENIELLLQSVAGDSSAHGPCRCTVILRGVTRQ